MKPGDNHHLDIFANRLFEIREACGYGQKYVASFLGFFSEEQLLTWENGTELPHIIHLFKLSELYKVLPHELYPGLLSYHIPPERIIQF